MSQHKGAPLLDLETLVAREHILIDGQRYELRSPGELSVAEALRFQRWGRQMEALREDDGTEAMERLETLTAEAARAILVDVPEAVFAKISGTQRAAIIEVFSALLLRETLRLAGAIEVAAGPKARALVSPTGARFSPGSSASTVALRQSGFIARLWRWFGFSSE